MAEAVRPRTVEYYNPRPLILGVCFFWGVVMGFCLYFFRAPERMTEQNRSDGAAPVAARPTMTEQERRRQDLPVITEVELSQPDPAGNRPRLETMAIDPPAPVLTTDGGLTGRTAAPLLPTTSRPPRGPQGPTPPATAPPPLPDLLP